MESLYKQIVKHEVVPALWCTEPVAIAFAVSSAIQYVSWKIEWIIITVDQDTLKNALGVVIPNSWWNKWVHMATALWLYADSSKWLECLSWLDSDNIESATNFANSWIIKSIIKDEVWLYISAKIITDNNVVESTVVWWHTNIISLKINWEEKLPISDELDSTNSGNDYQSKLKALSLDEMIWLAKSIDETDIEYLKKWIEMQFDIWDYFKWEFKEEYEKIRKSYSWPMYTKELSEILTRCTSATYARMSWVNKPVMSSWWSWNQWIVAILLPYLYATEVLWIDKDDRIIYESIALSNILNSYVKCYTWAISSMCWCSIAAWEWAIAGMLYLQWLEKEIWIWINNMIASSWWVLCDWAKVWCYNKVAASVVNVMNAVNQSINSLWVSVTDWIIWNDPLESIRNLSKIANEWWVTKEVIPILLSK